VNWRSLAVAVIAVCAFSAPLPAQDRAQDAPTSTLSPETTLNPRAPSPLLGPEKNTGNSQLIVYFVVLLSLAGAGLYFLKRGLPLRGARPGENRLQLLETKMLGNRQFLVVVKYEDNKVLLGVGPGQIQYLCQLDSADADMENLMREGGQDSAELL
jgi:flagellar protein FliO/FliZ